MTSEVIDGHLFMVYVPYEYSWEYLTKFDCE